MLRVLSLSMQSNITLVTIMASCAGFLLFFFVVAFLHFHEYLDYHCLRDRDFFSSKTLITILPSLHYQLHYHIALGLAIPKLKGVLHEPDKLPSPLSKRNGNGRGPNRDQSRGNTLEESIQNQNLSEQPRSGRPSLQVQCLH